jgi:eukaryotic-like serine/threonine-protein kinase
MPTKIGPFEVLSELAKSFTGAVYKANDPESGQTIALKAIQLSSYGENAAALEQALLAEAEKTKVLSCPNVTPVYGAGAIEGQFCAAMEYVQGNSIATMLARNEGFSIWDLLDIGRQLCSGLDHTASHNIVHYSLEPAKIMCGWDGTVRILSYGMSSVGNYAHQVTEGLPTILHYLSPEQVQGQPMDIRSNLFTLAAIFYEMVTERKAFDRDDIESLRQSIVESTPTPPIHVNPKVHPVLSDLIMKALSKDPAERFQTGRELLDELEKCKESKTLAAKPAPAKGTAAAVTNKAKAAAQSKFVNSATAKPAAKPSTPAASGLAKPATPATPAPSAPRASGLASPASRSAEAKSNSVKPAEKKLAEPAKTAQSPAAALATPVSKLAAPKAAAAAAGAGGAEATSSTPAEQQEPVREIDLSDSFISASVKATIEAAEKESAYMSSAVADEPQIDEPQIDEPQVETFDSQVMEPPADEGPTISVDPMMAEGGAAKGGGTSFSEISELPPLKEVYVASPPPPPVFQDEPAKTAMPSVYDGTSPAAKKDEKPKVQPREVAQKAIKEIKGVPPKLMGYALGGAAVLILVIGIAVTVYIHSQNSEDDAGTARPTATDTSTQPEASQPAKSAPAPAQAAPAPAAAPEEASNNEAPAGHSATAAAASAKSHNAKKKAAPAAPVVVPGQMAIDSTPQGAQVQLDGRSDPSYVTPFALTNLDPGAHSITVSKSGFNTDTRSVMVTSGTRANVIVHLNQLMATLVVNSNPAGANVYIDGRDTGTKTPAQVSVDKGQHVVLVRKMGYIDETQAIQFALGQTFNFAPELRALGNADSVHTVGKMSKLFGGKGTQAGQTVVSIHTTPKGAQVAINQHIMDKNSPLDVALDPGNYVIDITLTGYAPVHKIVTANNGGKIVMDEVLQPAQ